ncbi:hypothetical protein HELRODRAFT_168598 [Helobdella robusta]|uniref:Uncharacterized protein n=1 Tax=Helobdella robusta TaxID=6412 RepID=T1F0S1_HELRO|nr:hypothetical protein HELRODRAFT_168598 [Helobdella robusta]ESO09589.1 hypothetical protein HELRODRAFT_168598 [Helobdella robusta]
MVKSGFDVDNGLKVKKEFSLLLPDIFCPKCNISCKSYINSIPNLVYHVNKYKLRKSESRIPNFLNRKITRSFTKLCSITINPSRFNHVATTVVKLERPNNDKFWYKIESRCGIDRLTSSVLSSPEAAGEDWDKNVFFSKLNLFPSDNASASNCLFRKHSKRLNVLESELHMLEQFDVTSNICKSCIVKYFYNTKDFNSLDEYCMDNQVKKCSFEFWPCTFNKPPSYYKWSHSYKFNKKETIKFLKKLKSKNAMILLEGLKTPVLRLYRVQLNISENISFICLNDLIANARESQNIIALESTVGSKLNTNNIFLNILDTGDCSLCITPPITPIAD